MKQPTRSRLSWPIQPNHPHASCCSCLNFYTYSFAKPMLDRGSNLAKATRISELSKTSPPTPLNAQDFPPVLHPSKLYQNKLNNAWQQEKQTSSKPKYWKSVLKTYNWWHCIYVAIAGGGRIFGALFLGYFVQQLENVTTTPTSDDAWLAITYGCLVLLGTLITSFAHHTFYYYVWVESLRMRVATVGLIYDKTTRLSLSSLGQATSGRVFNMAAGDSMRIQFGLMFVPYFVWAPIEAIIILGLLVWELGWAAAVGWSFFVLCFVPLQLIFSRMFAKLQFQAAKAADHRIKLTTEVATGAACVKSHCWENAFVQLVDQARNKEISILTKIAALRGLNEGIFFSSTTVVGGLIFLIHTWVANESLPSKSVMVCLQLLMILQLTCAKFLCLGIMGYSQAFISMQRIEHFLQREEVKGSAGGAGGAGGAGNGSKNGTETRKDNIAIEYKNASASWEEQNETNTNDTNVLSKINISIPKNSLVMVVGPVGSGKTSLLMSMLSELPITQGSLYIDPLLQESTAFVGQTPYIQSGSVIDNILFGSTKNKKLLQKVLTSCDLNKDLSQLSNGDRTLVGEKGVTLSGGQRARVALARATYAQADFVLLDDPLSAVDPHVASLLMSNVITADRSKGGLRSSKTTIVLCTHQVQFANHADVIVIFGSNGTVVASGSYEQLKNHPALYRDSDAVEDETVADNAGAGGVDAGAGGDTEANGVQEKDSKESKESKESKQNGNSANSKSEINENGVVVEVVAEDDENNQSRTISTLSTTSKASRTSSTNSTNSTNSYNQQKQKKQEEMDRFENSEKRQTGIVQWSTYGDYLSAGGGCLMFVPLAICMASSQGLRMFTAWLMTVLAKKSILRANVFLTGNSSSVTTTDIGAAGAVQPLSDVDFETIAMLVIVFGVLALLLALIRSIWFFIALVKSAQTLHSKMIRSVVRAPMKFYDTNPTGRILNRFSSDIGFADDQMPASAFDFVGIAFQVLGMVAMSAVANPFVLIVLLPLIYAFMKLRSYYMDTSREIKRVEALSRSPVFGQLSETLAGLVTIRGYKGGKNKTNKSKNVTNDTVVESFRSMFNQKLDQNMSHFYAFIATARWFGFRLDFINHGFTFSCVIIVLILRFGFPAFGATIIDSNLVGLSILYMMQGGDAFQWCVRQAAEVENMMVSIERIREYIQLIPEASLHSSPLLKKKLIDTNWPASGTLELKNVSLQYSSNGPLVLNDVSLKISPGDKVALVGRTGAGKSSLLSALFRLTEPTKGKVIIDGVDISTLGLHDARGALSIIPQSPWLFSGTIRSNLDPFGTHDDAALMAALKSCQLSNLFTNLDVVLTEAGGNLSTGERQLVCLARALLSSPDIIVLDEATANVDMGTDQLIQKTVRKEFENKTLIVIAHRINTIIDSDQVVVLDGGKVVEKGTPFELLNGGSGDHFLSMVKETGEESSIQLRVAAEEGEQLRLKRMKKMN